MLFAPNDYAFLSKAIRVWADRVENELETNAVHSLRCSDLMACYPCVNVEQLTSLCTAEGGSRVLMEACLA